MKIGRARYRNYEKVFADAKANGYSERLAVHVVAIEAFYDGVKDAIKRAGQARRAEARKNKWDQMTTNPSRKNRSRARKPRR